MWLRLISESSQLDAAGSHQVKLRAPVTPVLSASCSSAQGILDPQSILYLTELLFIILIVRIPTHKLLTSAFMKLLISVWAVRQWV